MLVGVEEVAVVVAQGQALGHEEYLDDLLTDYGTEVDRGVP